MFVGTPVLVPTTPSLDIVIFGADPSGGMPPEGVLSVGVAVIEFPPEELMVLGPTSELVAAKDIRRIVSELTAAGASVLVVVL